MSHNCGHVIYCVEGLQGSRRGWAKPDALFILPQILKTMALDAILFIEFPLKGVYARTADVSHIQKQSFNLVLCVRQRAGNALQTVQESDFQMGFDFVKNWCQLCFADVVPCGIQKFTLWPQGTVGSVL